MPAGSARGRLLDLTVAYALAEHTTIRLAALSMHALL